MINMHLAIPKLQIPQIVLNANIVFHEKRTSYLSLHLSTELCSPLHKILTEFSGAQDGLEKKDFHAMTNLTFVRNG